MRGGRRTRGRVIEEYKRFVFLAMRADHVVCPSEDVDQIWHMHLTYTRSYWEKLCGQVLDKPLHHGPTQGGREEHVKYFKLYQKTKQSYRDWFGEEPPSDIWPSAEQRFGEDLHFVRINAAHHWIVPKLTWRGAAVGVGGASMMFPIAQLMVNPLEMRGPQFLMLFFGLLVVAVVGSILARFLLNRGAESASFQLGPAHDLDVGPIEVAWMKGGKRRAVSCALVDLAQREAVEIDSRDVKAGPNSQSVSVSHRISKLILNSVNAEHPLGVKWPRLSREVNVGLVGLRQDLEDKGLASTLGQRSLMGAVPAILLGGLLLLGAAKIVVGLNRGRPVDLLIVGEIVVVGAAVVLLATLPRLTSQGKQLLRSLKEKSPEEIANSKDAPGHKDDVLLWGTALMRIGVLASTPYADLQRFSVPVSSSASSGGWWCNRLWSGQRLWRRRLRRWRLWRWLWRLRRVG